MKKLFVGLMALGSFSTLSFANSISQGEILDALQSDKISCDSSRKESGFSVFPEIKEVRFDFINVLVSSSDLRVVDRSGRANRTTTIYKDACEINQTQIRCNWSDGNLSIDLDKTWNEVYENPLTARRLVGYRTRIIQERVRWGLFGDKRDIRCTFFSN